MSGAKPEIVVVVPVPSYAREPSDGDDGYPDVEYLITVLSAPSPFVHEREIVCAVAELEIEDGLPG